MGEARIAKRLDQFLLSGDFSNNTSGFRQWVGSGGEAGVSDHSPILLELARPHKKPPGPFKFNVGSLKEVEYHQLVVEN